MSQNAIPAFNAVCKKSGPDGAVDCTFEVGKDIKFGLKVNGAVDRYEYWWEGRGAGSESSESLVSVHAYETAGTFHPEVEVFTGGRWHVRRCDTGPITITAAAEAPPDITPDIPPETDLGPEPPEDDPPTEVDPDPPGPTPEPPPAEDGLPPAWAEVGFGLGTTFGGRHPRVGHFQPMIEANSYAHVVFASFEMEMENGAGWMSPFSIRYSMRPGITDPRGPYGRELIVSLRRKEGGEIEARTFDRIHDGKQDVRRWAIAEPAGNEFQIEVRWRRRKADGACWAVSINDQEAPTLDWTDSTPLGVGMFYEVVLGNRYDFPKGDVSCAEVCTLVEYSREIWPDEP